MSLLGKPEVDITTGLVEIIKTCFKPQPPTPCNCICLLYLQYNEADTFKV